jgi:GntR family transcriptional regulator
MPLVNEKMISRQQGKGTFFVGAAPEKQSLQPLSGALESLLHYEANSEVRIVDKAKWSRAPEDIRTALGVDAGTAIVVFKRVLVSNGVPLTYLANHLPAEFGDRLFKDDIELRRYPITSLLKDKYKIPVTRATQTIEAVLADPLLAQHLEITVGSPLLFVERTFFCDDGRVAQFTRSWYVSHVCKYTVELRELRAPPWRPLPDARQSGKARGRRRKR